MKLPKLIAMIVVGKRVMYTNQNSVNPGGPCEDPDKFNEVIMGTIRKTIGRMKIPSNSRRRVKALRSLRINAAWTEEKPILPKNPVLGAYAPWEIVMAGGS